MPLEEVAACASHEVLMEVDNNISLIVGGSQGILNHSLGLTPSTY
jgi:hypothetical protein